MNLRRLLPSFAFALLIALPVLAEPQIGIGVALGINPSDETPVVALVFRNSPAERAGLPKGAVIEKINGIATAGRTIEECIAQIRGPEGIPVLLEFIDPATGKSTKLMIVRGKFNPDDGP
jgi:C-terminal processing protease CtpA/Prc